MRSVDVLYFVEHVGRELDVACLVKTLCETRDGLSVKIASLPWEVEAAVRDYRPRIVVVPYCTSANIFSFPTILEKCKEATFLNLNYEEFFTPLTTSYKTPQDDFAKHVVWHYAWSTPFKNYLVTHGVAPSHIFVYGNPSFRLYDKPYRDYFPSRLELAQTFGLDHKKRWILFPENFRWAFYPNSLIEIRIGEGCDPNKAYACRDLNRKIMYETIGWLARLAKRDDTEVIFRPRPAIPAEWYERLFQEEFKTRPPGLRILKAGSLHAWNLASDVALSVFSTGLLDAAVAEKPAYFLEPLPLPDWLQEDWYDLLPRIRSYSELEAVCSGEASFSFSARDHLRQNFLGQGDPFENITALLKNLLNEPPVPPPAGKAPGPSWTPRALAVRLRRKALVFFRSFIFKDRSSFSYANLMDTQNAYRDDRFSEEEVLRRSARWRQTLS